MVDFNKISQKVAAFVDETMKLDGNKKKIDTQRECDKIGEYLNKNRADLGSQEVQYLEGLQVEFTTTEEQRKAQEAQKDFEASMTRGTKEAVDRIAKRMENKKLIDTDEEAQALLLMLRNTKGEYNKFDLEYIRQTLIKAGYESLLPKDEANNVEDKKTDEAENTNANDTENTKEADTCNCNCDCKQDEQVGTGGGTTTEPPKGDDKKGEPTKVDEPLGTDAPPRANRPPKKKARIDDPLPKRDEPSKKEPPKADNPPKSEEPTGTEQPTKVKQPAKNVTIKPVDARYGERLAKLVHDEVTKFGNTDENKINQVLSEVTPNNAFSFFVEYMNLRGNNKQINNHIFGSLADKNNDIQPKSILPAMKAFLEQASNMGLEDTPQYTRLKNVIDTYEKLQGNGSDPNKTNQLEADGAINSMIKLINKKF